MRRFGKFFAILSLVGAITAVTAIEPGCAEIATWWGEDTEFNAAVAAEGRENQHACADYPQATCTCAHSRVPLGTHLDVWYHGRSVVCRVNDVRPFKDADIVLSFGAARVLGFVEPGHASVSIRRLRRLE